jgi:hypothetical protein
MTEDGTPDDATLVMALDLKQVGAFSAADAVRLATTITRSERFGDGNIGAGVLQAVIATLAAWYRDSAEVS